MPTYRFLNLVTEEEEDHFMKIAELDDFITNNPHLQKLISAPMLVTSVSGMGSHKVPDGFKEVIAKATESHPTSPLAEKHGKKSIKQIKTQQVVKKHLG